MNNMTFKPPYLPTLSVLTQQVLRQNYILSQKKRFFQRDNDSKLKMHFPHSMVDSISLEKHYSRYIQKLMKAGTTK